jgi:hypothetical protein
LLPPVAALSEDMTIGMGTITPVLARQSKYRRLGAPPRDGSSLSRLPLTQEEASTRVAGLA